MSHDESPAAAQITRLLHDWRAGDEGAVDELVPLVYQQLRRMATSQMRREGAVTLQPTALVHEAYLRLVGVDVQWQDREHFFALASSMMRRILVDEAKRRRAEKRGGGEQTLLLVDDLDGVESVSQPTDLLALDGALTQLGQLDERKVRVVELRCFAGLTIDECARVLEVGRATVERDLKMARAWLVHHMGDGGPEGPSP
ncbi:MAG: sigma-70 family RNA polymerase sigma factor [Acidobacteriota bacterium]